MLRWSFAGNEKDLSTLSLPQQALTFLPELHLQRYLRLTLETSLLEDVDIYLKSCFVSAKSPHSLHKQRYGWTWGGSY